MTYSYPTWIINDMLLPLDDLLDVTGTKDGSPWDGNISKNFVYNGKTYAVKAKMWICRNTSCISMSGCSRKNPP